MRNRLVSFVCLFVIAEALSACSTAPKSGKQTKLMEQADATVEWFEANVKGLPKQLDSTGGFVVFPDVIQFGLSISGGNFGRGVLCKPDGTQIGWAAINTGSLGLQAGARGFKMLVVFQDQATMDKFTKNQLSGSTTGVLVAVDAGISASSHFQNGVVVYEGASKGLMAGVNIGLKYMRYQPFEPQEEPGDVR